MFILLRANKMQFEPVIVTENHVRMGVKVSRFNLYSPIACLLNSNEGWQITCELNKMKMGTYPWLYKNCTKQSSIIQSNITKDPWYREKTIAKNAIKWGIIGAIGSMIFNRKSGGLCSVYTCSTGTGLLHGAMTSLSYIVFAYYGPIMIPGIIGAWTLHARNYSGTRSRNCYTDYSCPYHSAKYICTQL